MAYGYNGLRMRVRRTQGRVTQRYLYDESSNLVAELASTGNPLRTYTHLGLAQPHSMRTWSGTTPGAVHYYALDLPGNNVNGLFNGSGTVTNRYYYTPWGQAQSTSEATYNPLRYASRELDPASGLYYNRARWYDPYLGRFISEDPIGIDGGINVYAYAGNDPVNYIDPSGLAFCTAGAYTKATTCYLDDFYMAGGGERYGRNDHYFSRFLFSSRGRSMMGGMERSPRHADGSEGPSIGDFVQKAVDAVTSECGTAIALATISTVSDLAFGGGLGKAAAGGAMWLAGRETAASLLTSGGKYYARRHASAAATHLAYARAGREVFVGGLNAAGVGLVSGMPDNIIRHQASPTGPSVWNWVPIVGSAIAIVDAVKICTN